MNSETIIETAQISPETSHSEVPVFDDEILQKDLDAMAIHDFRLGKPRADARMMERDLWGELEKTRAGTKVNVNVDH